MDLALEVKEQDNATPVAAVDTAEWTVAILGRGEGSDD